MSAENVATTVDTPGVVVVTIMGQEYPLRCGADKRHIEKVAEYVSAKMRLVADANPSCSQNEIAILAALNVADELFDKNHAGAFEASALAARAQSILVRLEERLPALPKHTAAIG